MVFLVSNQWKEFFISDDYKKYKGIVDFVSKDLVKLKDVKNYFNSTTELGNHVYENNLDFVNPIFILNEKYNKSGKCRSLLACADCKG